MSNRKLLFPFSRIPLRWLSLLLLTGCLSDNGLGSAAMAQDNIWNLSRLSIGMSESQVLYIMSHPYRKQSFENQGDVYHIWFYVTRPAGLDQSRLVRQNLTPLTFENGVLLGWGFDFYHHIVKKVEAPSKIEKAHAQPQPMQDKPLEKAIEGIEEPTAPQKTTTEASEMKNKNKKKSPQPKGTKPSEEPQPKETKPSEEPQPKETKPSEEPKKPEDRLNDQDRDMIQEENEQNFNFY